MKQETSGYFSTDVTFMAKSTLLPFVSHDLRLKFNKISQNTSLASGQTPTDEFYQWLCQMY